LYAVKLQKKFNLRLVTNNVLAGATSHGTSWYSSSSNSRCLQSSPNTFFNLSGKALYTSDAAWVLFHGIKRPCGAASTRNQVDHIEQTNEDQNAPSGKTYFKIA
jgi:hypothetical protein